MQHECASVTQSTHLAGEVSLRGTVWESREDRVIHNTVGEIMGNTSYRLGFFLCSVGFFGIFFFYCAVFSCGTQSGAQGMQTPRKETKA